MKRAHATRFMFRAEAPLITHSATMKENIEYDGQVHSVMIRMNDVWVTHCRSRVPRSGRPLTNGSATCLRCLATKQ